MQMELLFEDAIMSMRDRHWMPFYVDDFRMSTLDLQPDEIGLYLIMLMLAWQSGDGSITGDMRELKTVLQRLANFHGLTFNRIVPKLLDRYFKRREDGKFYQERVEKELRKVEELSEKRSRIAKERWSRDKEIKDLADTNGMLTQHNTTQHSSKKDIEGASPCSAPTKATRLSEHWQPSPDHLHFAENEGLSASEIEREAAKFRDYWVGRADAGGVKRDWSATWRNWVRKAKEGKSNGRWVQDDSKSASAAAGRLAELAERGVQIWGPRPSLLPAEGTNVVRLLPEGRGERPGDLRGGDSGSVRGLPDASSGSSS